MSDKPLRYRLGPKTDLVLLQADITGLSHSKTFSLARCLRVKRVVIVAE